MKRAVTLIEAIIVVAIVGILAAIIIPNVMQPSVEPRAIQALEDEGYSEVDIYDTGWGGAWNGCGDSDNRSAQFGALNVKGKRVEGVVCCGWMKGCTVRH